MPVEPHESRPASDGPRHVALIMDGNGRWAQARGLPRAMGHREGVRVRILGRREGLPADITRIVEQTEASTAHNDKFLLQVAFNYGGRADIVDAARRYADQVLAGQATGPLDEETLGQGLSTAGGPPVDVIVRTSGEQRLSNFLLWEAAYAELVFQNVLWPDYGREALADVVDQYRNRDRRFGGLSTAPALAAS